MRGKAVLVVAVLSLVAAPPALAQDGSITSFDGTKIVYHWFPAEGLEPGQTAPTVLSGPGWSQAGDSNPDSATDNLFGGIGNGPLRKAGYNVLTWDPRGFGASGGTVTVDSPDAEGRDVQGLISEVAAKPEALLDGPGDPRAGMVGPSYGGGIQLVTAGIDDRLDAIVPDIAWNSLRTSLYKDDTFKGGWGTALYSLGKVMGTLDPHIDSAYTAGTTTGKISDADRDWFASRGPGDALVSKIRIPTFLTQGTADTLFTLQEAVRNYGILRGNGVPVKMLWFCGGHGACLTPAGPAVLEQNVLAWLGRWLKRDTSVDTGPRFDWVDQDGTRASVADYPPAAASPIVATGSGTLPLVPGPGTGLAIASAPAPTALSVPVKLPSSPASVVAAPKLTLSYSGTAAPAGTTIYAQIVDDATGIVLGNQVTPLPLTLDGRTRTLERPLEIVSALAKPGATWSLQLFAASNVYDAQRSAGEVTFSAIRLEIGTADTGTPPPGPSGAAPKRPSLRVKIGRLSAKKRTGAARVVVAPVDGEVRNVVVSLVDKRGTSFAAAPSQTLAKRTRFVLKPSRAMKPGVYRVVAAGFRPDGTALRKKSNVRKPKPPRRRKTSRS
jgi:ABC-2 type transport system ATP-binding protein